VPGIEATTKKKQRQEDEVPPVSTIDPQVVLDNVFKQLGKPHNLCQISSCLTRATPITQKSFRVMIYCKTEVSERGIGAAPVLTDTFFVHVNDEGKIINSDEPIVKKY
jgi:hypothetical protein